MDPISLVKSLELAEYTGPAMSLDDKTKYSDHKRDGFADCGSLVSFTVDVSGQQKEDVLNSSLFAQRAADFKYNRTTDQNNWYKYYTEVMGKLGWVIQSFSFDKYQSSTDSVKISNVILKLVSDLVGQKAKLAQLVRDALDALQASADATAVFQSSSASREHANFQVVPCTVDKSNQVNVAFIASYFHASEVSTNYLFVTMKKEDISLYNASQTFTLDESLYSQIREAVREKLGDSTKKFIKSVNLK